MSENFISWSCFRAVGTEVNLCFRFLAANIITDLTINESTGVPVINEAISHIKSAAESSDDYDQSALHENLEILNGELGKVSCDDELEMISMIS